MLNLPPIQPSPFELLKRFLQPLLDATDVSEFYSSLVAQISEQSNTATQAGMAINVFFREARVISLGYQRPNVIKIECEDQDKPRLVLVHMAKVELHVVTASSKAARKIGFIGEGSVVTSDENEK